MLEQILDIFCYELGDPWRFNDSSLTVVIPILRRDVPDRKYVLLQEVQDKVDLEDTGSIGKTVVKNKTGSYVFIRKGTLLKGGTQERGVTVGTVILPDSTREIEVQCVHASRGIMPGARLRVSNVIAPRPVMQSFMARRSQSATWHAISRATESYYAMAATPVTYVSDDLVGVLERTQEFKDDVEEILRKVPADLNDQVGIAIVDIKGVLGLEVFDHPDSWRAFSKSVVRSYADVLAEKTSDLYEIRMDRVKEAVSSFIERLGEAEEKVVAEVEGSRTYALDGKGFVGEYTVLNGSMIHLIASRREPEEKRSEVWWRAPTRTRSERTTYSPTYSNWITTTYSPPEEWRDRYMRYFSGKGSLDLLESLHKPKTWKDLEDRLNVSTRTLSKRIREASTLNLIYNAPRLENGRQTYRLTSIGKKALEWAKKRLR